MLRVVRALFVSLTSLLMNGAYPVKYCKTTGLQDHQTSSYANRSNPSEAVKNCEIAKTPCELLGKTRENFRKTNSFRSSSRNHFAVQPPSTASDWPVTKDASFEQSHRTAAAISSGLPVRPIGC